MDPLYWKKVRGIKPMERNQINHTHRQVDKQIFTYIQVYWRFPNGLIHWTILQEEYLKINYIADANRNHTESKFTW